MKKRYALTLSALILMSGVLGFMYLDRLFFPNTNELNKLNRQCMEVRPGVSLSELQRLFGVPRHFQEEGYVRYLFGSHEYSVLFSDYIVAKINAEGEIIDFRCGEGMYPWKK